MSDHWIDNIIEKSQELVVNQIEEDVIAKLVEIVYIMPTSDANRRLALAASFDLLANAEYYRSVGHIGWFYCPVDDAPLLIYPYTNVCPRCALKNEFVFHEANKPKSGVIGARTSRLLAVFLQTLFIKNGRSIIVRKGVEPVDVVLLDQHHTPTAVMFAEIKAAPLVTLPLAITSQRFTEDENGVVTDVGHRITDHTALYGSELSLMLPTNPQENRRWELIPFGSKKDADDELWAYRSLLDLLESNPAFMPKYLAFWRSALASYEQKSQSGVFWLTNACGQPSPRPEDWPRRRSASGFESISDSKTSVGMDRTDDLKKATYQSLKIGAEGNPSADYHYRVGIISNIHAVRHYEAYLTSIQDIVWTRDKTASAKTAVDLPPDTPLFNLFDGIIALTQTTTRDKWVEDIFDF